MSIALRKAQQDWLDQQVTAGRFASIDDSWAEPLIADAIDALDRGEGTPWRKGEVQERIKAGRIDKP